MSDRPEILGLHHVRLPVSDVLASRDWYVETLGLSPLMVTEEEASVIGEALVHDSGLVVGLHADPDAARSLEGFCVLALSVDDLPEWSDYLDRIGIEHTPLERGPRGDHLSVSDPDGLVIELHTLAQPSTEET